MFDDAADGIPIVILDVGLAYILCEKNALRFEETFDELVWRIDAIVHQFHELGRADRYISPGREYEQLD